MAYRFINNFFTTIIYKEYTYTTQDTQTNMHKGFQKHNIFVSLHHGQIKLENNILHLNTAIQPPGHNTFHTNTKHSMQGANKHIYTTYNTRTVYSGRDDPKERYRSSYTHKKKQTTCWSPEHFYQTMTDYSSTCQQLASGKGTPGKNNKKDPFLASANSRTLG